MYAVIDVETGGFSKEKNGLCEVAILILDKEKNIINEFSSKIKPYLRPDSDDLVSYKESAMSIHGITMDELNNAPDTIEVSEKIEFTFNSNGVTTIIAHNAKYMDKAWIEYFLERFGKGFKFEDYICTLDLARGLKLDVENNKLSTLCKHFGIINKSEHRALEDCYATYKLLLELEK